VLNRLKQIVGRYTSKNGYLPKGLAIGDLVAFWSTNVVEKYGVVISKGDYERAQSAKIPFRKIVPVVYADGRYDFNFNARKVEDHQAEMQRISAAYSNRISELNAESSKGEIERLRNERDALIKFIQDYAEKTSNTNVAR